MSYLHPPVAKGQWIFILCMVSTFYILLTILLPKYISPQSNSGTWMAEPRSVPAAYQEISFIDKEKGKIVDLVLPNEFMMKTNLAPHVQPLINIEIGQSNKTKKVQSNQQQKKVVILEEKEIKMTKDKQSSEFWINTPTCVIPKTPIGNRSMRRKKLNCGSTRPLTEAHGTSITMFPERLVDYKDAKGEKSMTCEYKGIVRVQEDPDNYTIESDKTQRLKPAVQLVDMVTSVEEDGVQVYCSVNIRKHKKVIYKNVHTFFQPWRISSKLKLFKSLGGWSNSPHMLNVVIVGVDSVSRINLMRHMPKTYNFLTKNLSAVDFPGYNKVADNTDPNLSAMLMGWSWEQFKKQKICHKTLTAKFDDCPLLWKNFSSNGYITAYAEDAPSLGVFHYSNRKGYVLQPTDYYNRPYFIMSSKLIGNNGNFPRQDEHRCQGTKASFDIVNDWTLQLLREIKEVPVFSFTWTTSSTHGDYEDARLLDDSFLNYLKNLKNEGHLDNTVLVFVSDHGMRFGTHRQTYPGMMEERLPYLLLVFPPRFKEKYPVSWNNMNLNKNRLVTHHDLHSTLLAVLNQDYINNSPQDYAYGYGQSLFHPIPLNRTCESVGILDHYCTCAQSEELDPSSGNAHRAAVAAVKHINKLLIKYLDCSRLELHEISSARLQIPHNSTITLVKSEQKWRKKRPMKKVVQHSQFYLVTFETIPGNAVFESTIKKSDAKMTISDVSRVNKYGNQSHCVQDNVIKKFCFCNDLLH